MMEIRKKTKEPSLISYSLEREHEKNDNGIKEKKIAYHHY